MTSVRLSFATLFAFLCAAEMPGAPIGVTVDVQPPNIVRRTFDPANPPAEMPPLVPPEVGQCVYEFACEMETRVVQPAGFSRRRTARVTATAFTTRLNVTLWTPIAGPAGVLEHEEGHRIIAEFYYRRARDVARRLGQQALATPLVVSAASRPALETALNELQNRLIKSYLAETLDRCSVAQRRFDEITHHSRARVPVDAAIAQAISDENAAAETAAKSHAPTTSRRAPPTRPRSS